MKQELALTAPKQPMSVQQLLDFLNKTPASQRQVEESKLQIVVLQPGGIGGTPVVGVEQAHFGFDWDARKLLLYPMQPLTRLASEDVAAIHKSAKEGQSWHAYQQYTKQAACIKALEAEIVALRQDALRLDWLALQDLDDTVFGLVKDAHNDGDIAINVGHGAHYGKTLRSALDAAMAQAVQPTQEA